MRALEFKSKIEDNHILIPNKLRSELKSNQNIRVIVFIDDSEIYDTVSFKKSTSEEFLKGYSDSIYDTVS